MRILHKRHYTLDEANASRQRVTQLVRRMRRAKAVIDSPEAQVALEGLDPDLGGAWPGRELTIALLKFNAAMIHLDEMDVILRDIETGLVDFPAIRDGEEIYLCWRIDEQQIAWWHDPESGAAGRRPL